ncbi:uncharacterized protein LOC110848684 [Folsomia candida]|uniref:uncharacterized protein LOC110848684 n=1 Tax=Folsomia candida TaxID=158441 RepID=UPI001604CD1E|nr:uncharacterized protein LOC110848684 [Folsomia candida]
MADKKPKKDKKDEKPPEKKDEKPAEKKDDTPGDQKGPPEAGRRMTVLIGQDGTGISLVPMPAPSSDLSILSKNVPGGGAIPAVIRAPGMEGEGMALQLEEAEVLPYESVFEWDIQDPVGYYAEDEKYAALLKVFEKDEVKVAVLDGMWRDRIKYQVLRRFTWPPPLFLKQIFFTRGYYEDYEPRPTVNIQWLHLQRDAKRQKQEAKMRRAGENRYNLQMAFDNSLGPKASLSEFDESIYNRNLLVIRGLSRDTDPALLRKMFPKGHVVLLDDGMGGLKAEVEFKNLDDARAGYRTGMSSNINGHRLNILPKRWPRPSLSDFDPVVYNREILVIRGLEKDVPIELLKEMFPKAKIVMKDNGTGGQTAEMTFDNEDDSSEAYLKAISSKIKGYTINILPIERKPHPKDSLSQFDPVIYNREILIIKNMPKTTDLEKIKKMFPNGTVTAKDNGKGGFDIEIAFKSYDDSAAAYKKALNEKIDGKPFYIRPIQWEGEYGPGAGGKGDDLSKFKKPAKPPPPPVITGQKKSLSEFDPLVYNRQILNIKGLSKDTPQSLLDQMFPTGIVTMKDDGKGGLEAEIEFQSEDDSRAAFRHALKSKIKGQAINILPIMRLPGSGQDDIDRGDVIYANPYMIKSKIQAHPLRSKDPPKGVKPKTTKKLNEYDPIDYDYLKLDVHGIPPGTKKEDIKKIFPRASEIKSLDPDVRYPGKLNAVVIFKTREDAMYSYIDNHEQIINGGEMDIIPQRKDGKPEPLKGKGGKPIPVAAPAPVPSAVADKKPDKPKVAKALTSYNPLDFDYLNLDVSNIAAGTTKDQVQKMFKTGKIIKFEPNPVNPKMMIAVVSFETREDAIEDYKNAIDKPLNGLEIDIVPQKLSEDAKKKKKKEKAPKQEEPASTTEVIEEVSYEVVKKPKKEKKARKSKATTVATEEPSVEVVEEVTYEVVKKPKKEKKEKK